MIKPILHRILVRQDKLEDKDEAFAAGARIPGFEVIKDERKREQAAIDTGVVVAIGATAFRDFGVESPIKVGDYVVYAKYGGKTMIDPEDKTQYVALNDEDVIAIVTTEGA